MKIIDQTPFFKENGALSLMDRGRAILQFGSSWIKEVEGQNAIIAVLGKNLDKKFTLLHNVTPPALGTMLPLVLIGPTGVYVMGINPLPGLFSARGDQWGVISGGVLKPEKPNLMDRAERMARAVQLYLQRQGFTDLNNVDAVLLCSDPAATVDSVRPIIRVVMRDALERFAVSISQARLVISPESVADIVDRLLNPPAPAKPKPVEAAAGLPEPAASSSILTASAPPAAEITSNDQAFPPPPAWLNQPGQSPFTSPESEPAALSPQMEPPVRRRGGITRRQWVYLIVMIVVWIIILAVFAFLVARDFMPR